MSAPQRSRAEHPRARRTGRGSAPNPPVHTTVDVALISWSSTRTPLHTPSRTTRDVTRVPSRRSTDASSSRRSEDAQHGPAQLGPVIGARHGVGLVAVHDPRSLRGEVEASLVEQVHGLRGVLHRQPHQVRVCGAGADPDDVRQMGFGAVDDASLELASGPAGRQVTSRHVQRTTDGVGCLDQEHPPATIGQSRRAGQPGGPGADHHGVVHRHPRSAAAASSS